MNATDEWYAVERVTEHSWRITEGGLFGSYLIEGDDRALVVDAGAGIGDLRGLVEKLTNRPVTLLLSHSHWDHIGNASQFENVIADEREHDGGRVAGTGLAYGPDEWIADWRAAGNDFPDEFDADNYRLEPATSVETVVPGDSIDLGETTVELIATPGHSRGHLGVLDRASGILYGGDVLHRDHGLYVHFDGCSLRDYVETFDRLVDLRDAGDFDTLHVSHASSLAGDDLSLFDEFYDGLNEILADEREYERIDDGVPARRYQIAGKDVLTKPDIT